MTKDKEIDIFENEKNIKIKALELAKLKYEQLKKVEPDITSDLKGMEDTYCNLVGLEHRFKNQDSMSRKIISDSKADNISLEVSAQNISDGLRYAVQISEEEYSNKVISNLNYLISKGYKIMKFKNFWGNNVQYKGINVNVVSPGGTKIEVQFHTPSSFLTKEVLNHKHYEIVRDINSTELEEQMAKKAMISNQNKVLVPLDAERLEWRK